MLSTLIALVALAFGPGEPDYATELKEREVFARRIATIIRSGKVDEFVKLLSPGGLVCHDGVIPAKAAAARVRRSGDYFNSLLFDTKGLKKQVQSLREVLSYRDFLLREKDAIPIIEMDWNIVRWESDTVDEAPYFGVERVGGRLRIGLLGANCH